MSKYTGVTLDQNVQDQDPEETEAGKYGKLGLIWWCWTILQKKIMLMVRKQNMEICFQPRYTGCTTFCIGTECQHTSWGVYLSNKTVILFFTVEVRGWNLRFSFDIIKSPLLCLSLLSPSMSIVSLHLPAFLCHLLPYFSFSHSPYLFSHLPSYPPPTPPSIQPSLPLAV